jgi:hypothetical protein
VSRGLRYTKSRQGIKVKEKKNDACASFQRFSPHFEEKQEILVTFGESRTNKNKIKSYRKPLGEVNRIQKAPVSQIISNLIPEIKTRNNKGNRWYNRGEKN